MTRKPSSKIGRLVERIAARHRDLPIKETVRVLVDQYRGEGTWYSPSLIAERLPGIKSADLMMALQVLSGAPYGVLTVKWTLLGSDVTHDPLEDEDHELFEVSATEAFRALGTGSFAHPLSGEEIAADRLHIHYEPNFPLVDKL